MPSNTTNENKKRLGTSVAETKKVKALKKAQVEVEGVREKIKEQRIIQQGYRGELLQKKKNKAQLQQERADIIYDLSGEQGLVEEFQKRKEDAILEMVVASAKLAKSFDDELALSRTEVLFLNKINTNVDSGVLNLESDRKKLSAFVKQVQEQIIGLNPKVFSNREKPAIVAYLISLGQNDAANSIANHGYIANYAHRLAAGQAFQDLVAKVKAAPPVAPPAVNPINNEEITVLKAILGVEIEKQEDNQNNAIQKRNDVLHRLKPNLNILEPVDVDAAVTLVKDIVVQEVEIITQENIINDDLIANQNAQVITKAMTDRDNAKANQKALILPEIKDQVEKNALSAAKLISTIDNKIELVANIIHLVNEKSEFVDGGKEAKEFSRIFNIKRSIPNLHRIDHKKITDQSRSDVIGILKTELLDVVETRNNLLAGKELINKDDLDKALSILKTIDGFDENLVKDNGTIPDLISALNGASYESAKDVTEAKENGKNSEDSSVILNNKIDAAQLELENDKTALDNEKDNTKILGLESKIKQSKKTIYELHRQHSGLDGAATYCENLAKDAALDEKEQKEYSNLKNETTKIAEKARSTKKTQNDNKIKVIERDIRALEREEKDLDSEVKDLLGSVEDAENNKKAAVVARDQVLRQKLINDRTATIAAAINLKSQASGHVGVVELAGRLAAEAQAIIDERVNYIAARYHDDLGGRDHADINNFDEAIINHRNFLAARDHADLGGRDHADINNFDEAIINHRNFLAARDHADLGGVGNKDIVNLNLAIAARKANSKANIDEFLFGLPTRLVPSFIRDPYNKSATAKIDAMIAAEAARDDSLFGDGNNVRNQAAVTQLNVMIAAEAARDASLFGDGNVRNQAAVIQLNKMIAAQPTIDFHLTDESLLEDLADQYYKVGGFEEVKKFWGDPKLGNNSDKKKAIDNKGGLKEIASDSLIKLPNDIKAKILEKQTLEEGRKKAASELTRLEDELEELDAKNQKASPEYIKLAVEIGKQVAALLDDDKKIEKVALEIEGLETYLIESKLMISGLKGLSGESNLEAIEHDVQISIKEIEEQLKVSELDNAKKEVAEEEEELQKKLVPYRLKSSKYSAISLINGDDDIDFNDAAIDPGVKASLEMASDIVTDLFSLTENDLVPEVARAKIDVNPTSADSARVYVAFKNRNDAIAFCSKMNEFKKNDGSNIIMPDAGFVASIDEESQEPEISTLEEIRDSYYSNPLKIPSYNPLEISLSTYYDIPKINDSYVVSFKVGGYDTSDTTSLDFAQQIKESDKAVSVVEDRDKRQSAKEVKGEREGMLRALAGLGGITPLVAGGLATFMNIFSSSLSKWGAPGATLFAAVTQALFEIAEATVKQPNPVSYFYPKKAEEWAISFKNASKEIQKVEEKEAARGVTGFRVLENSIMLPVRMFVTTPASIISNLFGALFNLASDKCANLSTDSSKYAGRKWSEGGLKNAPQVGSAYAFSLLTYLISKPCNACGILFSGLGKAFSKPAEYTHPEGSVLENRTKFDIGMGEFTRKMNKNVGNLRAEFAHSDSDFVESRSFKKLEIDVIKSDALTKEKLDDRAKAVVSVNDKAARKELFESVVSVALDVKDPKFNHTSGVKKDDASYLEVLSKVSFNSSSYRVLMDKDGLVVVTELGVTPRDKESLPDSLDGQLPSFSAEVLRSLALKKEQMKDDAPGVSSRESALLFTKKTAAVVMKEKLPSDYKEGDVYGVKRNNMGAKYYIQVKGNEVKIGRSKESMKEVNDSEAPSNIDLRKVVSSLNKASLASKSASDNKVQEQIITASSANVATGKTPNPSNGKPRKANTLVNNKAEMKEGGRGVGAGSRRNIRSQYNKKGVE